MMIQSSINKSNNFLKLSSFLGLFMLLFLMVIMPNYSSACDTSPVITASNPQSIGGGFYTVDVTVCIGTDGSQDGFDLTMGCGLNITATNQASFTNSGNTAVASISGGVLTYTYNPVPPGSWFEPDDGISGPCFSMTLTVNGNPENCTVTTTGVNDGCLIIQNSWSTTVPGPCLTNYSVTAPASQSGNTSGGGNTCTTRASQDNIIQVIIPCTDTWTFSLCGGSGWDTYLYLGTTCCGGTITQNDDACGLQSQITTALTAGTYYITVEAYSSSTTGAYTLNITSANPCNPLPSEYIQFSGSFDDMIGYNVLNWSTSSEIEVDYYAVEKSLNGIDFEQVGVVTGAGNSVIENEYVFIDNSINRSTSYYRLRQVDFDGAMNYSNVIVINENPNSQLNISEVYPNPNEGEFTVKLSPSKTVSNVDFELFSSEGKLVHSEGFIASKNISLNTVNVKDLPPGIYTAIVRTIDKIETHKVSITK